MRWIERSWHLCHVTTRILLLLTCVLCYIKDAFVADNCDMSQPGYFFCWRLYHVTSYNKDTCVADTCAMLQPGYFCCWHLCHVTTRIFLLQQGYLCTTLILMLLTLVPCHNQETCVADTCEMLQQGLCCWHLCHVITKVLVLPCYNKGTCFKINFVDLDPNRTRIN